MSEDKTLQYDLTLNEVDSLLRVLNKTQFAGIESAKTLLRLASKLEAPLIAEAKKVPVESSKSVPTKKTSLEKGAK